MIDLPEVRLKTELHSLLPRPSGYPRFRGLYLSLLTTADCLVVVWHEWPAPGEHKQVVGHIRRKHITDPSNLRLFDAIAEASNVLLNADEETATIYLDMLLQSNVYKEAALWMRNVSSITGSNPKLAIVDDLED